MENTFCVSCSSLAPKGSCFAGASADAWADIPGFQKQALPAEARTSITEPRRLKGSMGNRERFSRAPRARWQRNARLQSEGVHVEEFMPRMNGTI